MGEFGEKKRTPIAIEQVPEQFIQAILAAEDDAFLQHGGVDIKGLLRAAFELAATGRIQSGGSTITMQVAKNYFLTLERTFTRKFIEILLALQIEQELSKEEILELYINKIYLGNRAYGFQAAAQVYYGLPLNELSLAQLAMLSGLPKAPSANNPIANPERALSRRNWVLGRMHHLGMVDDSRLEAAKAQPITATYHGSKLELAAPFAAEMVRREMLQRFGEQAYTQGFRAITTLDGQLQRRGNEALLDGLLAYDQRHGYRGPEAQFPSTSEDPAQQRLTWLENLRRISSVEDLKAAIVTIVNEQDVELITASGELVSIDWQQGLANARPYISENHRGPAPNTAAEVLSQGDLVRIRQTESGWRLSQAPSIAGALVALSPDDGAIRTLVGGINFKASKFNRVTQARRQPGSNFKPFMYAGAMEMGFTPASLINDAPVVFEDTGLENTWRPENSSGKFEGPMRLREALYRSRNLVSVRLLRELGVNRVADYVTRFGFDKDQLPRNLSLALGTQTTTPMKLVSAYAVLANGGFRVTPYLIDKIEDDEGNILFQAQPAVACRECKEPILEMDTATEDSESATVYAERVVDPRTAYLIDSMLKDVIKRGTGRRAKALNRNDLAGKTGTTNGPTDAWFSGYGASMVATAWLGFDQFQKLGRNEFGGNAALPVWIDFMRLALEGVPEYTPSLPDGLVIARIDPATGLLAQPGQSDAIFETFPKELVPNQQQETSNSPDTPLENEVPVDEFELF
jgi:penicillin-binding protein 1A